MTIEEIKAELGVETLSMCETPNDEWLNDWRTDFVVSMHVETDAKLQKDKKLNTLFLQSGSIDTKNGKVKSFRICNGNAVVVSTY